MALAQETALAAQVAMPRIAARKLVFLQLGIQAFYFLALDLYDPRQTIAATLVAYATAFTLQLALKLARPGTKIRPFGLIASCNTVLLFFTAPSYYIALPIALAWATRNFLIDTKGRALANAGTYGVFFGGILSSQVFHDLWPIIPISHGFTTIPHFMVVVAALGAVMALLGNHVALVVPLLIGFALTRGPANAAELIIFLFAAPDPATSPKTTWHRWAVGLGAGAATGIAWQLNGRGNELTKVAGLVLASFVMPWVRDRDFAPYARRLLGKFGDAARWRGPVWAAVGASIVVGYGIFSDVFLGAKQFDLWVRARTGRDLRPEDVKPLIAGDIHVHYRDTRREVYWSTLNHNWDTFGTPAHPSPIHPGDPLEVRYHLACAPGRELSDSRLVRPRIVVLPRAGAMTTRTAVDIVLELDRDAIRARCAQ